MAPTNANLNGNIDNIEADEIDFDKLPKERFWNALDLYQWEGFWNTPEAIVAARTVRKHFEPQEDDVILASSMKTGSTWLRTLCISIMHRNSNTNSGEDEDPLVEKPFHALARNIEIEVFAGSSPSHPPHLLDMPFPRLFHTHLPYKFMPDSVKDGSSRCKIVYIARNPKDTFVSMWHFLNNIITPNDPYLIEKAFDCFCRGVHPYGPFFDHVTEYWNASFRTPKRIMFLRYEDLKKDPNGQVRKLASFLGRPFRDNDEEEVVKLVERCAFDRLKKLELDIPGDLAKIPSSTYFRCGVVGDWKNHLTEEMKERIDRITCEKFENTGLDLDG